MSRIPYEVYRIRTDIGEHGGKQLAEQAFAIGFEHGADLVRRLQAVAK
jgi:hypothetical protein